MAGVGELKADGDVSVLAFPYQFVDKLSFALESGAAVAALCLSTLVDETAGCVPLAVEQDVENRGWSHPNIVAQSDCLGKPWLRE